VLVPGILADDGSVLFKIERQELTAEGLHDGDLLLAKPAKGNVEGKLVILSTTKPKSSSAITTPLERSPTYLPCKALCLTFEFRLNLMM
jgi:hypothetical protein